MITTALLLAIHFGIAAPTELTPTAQEHHDRAIVHLDAGDKPAAIEEFERAYAALPDPVEQRAARGALLGAIRGTLLDLYDESQDPAHLVRLQALLIRHRDELQTALGPAATPEATSGTQKAIDEIEAEMQRVQPAPLLPAPAPVLVPPPPTAASVPPLHDPREAEEAAATRRRRRVGGALLGASMVPIAATIAGGTVYAARYRAIVKQGERVDKEGGVATDAQVETALKMQREGQAARIVAIVGASLGGALLVAGVAVLATKRRPQPRVGAAPLLSPQVWGLGLHGSF
jgi:hypothetical protein